jgi:hypothetical protein
MYVHLYHQKKISASDKSHKRHIKIDAREALLINLYFRL